MLTRITRAVLSVYALGAVACGDASSPIASSVNKADVDLPTASAKSQGFNGATLTDLARWIRDTPDLPVFSILISRRDTLIFELYTGGITRPEAHYMMSVSKSVLSSLVGAALKTGAIKSADVPITQLLPRSLFASSADVDRFSVIRLQDVMGMSALAVNDPPRDTSAASYQHSNSFWSTRNRVAFALKEPLLAAPSRDFLYNDEGPVLAAGAVQYATGKTLLDFGKAALFDSLGFVNEEWMHQDSTGIDMGGYGFRMRPMDMQKFGLLYLHGGLWKGKQLLPADWVARSFVPYMKSVPTRTTSNYGWFWWTETYSGWTFLVADGWKGQRIAINRDHDLVVTMSAYIEVQDEAAIFTKLLNQYVIPALTTPSALDVQSDLDGLIGQVHNSASRVKPNPEYRMVPSAASIEREIPFRP